VAQAESKPDSHHAYRVISREEIFARLQDPTLCLVNVMPMETFEAGHIPRSINLPVTDIETKASLLLSDVTREIVVYCAGPD
jgi:rhodanese-related sulfurtransferase